MLARVIGGIQSLAQLQTYRYLFRVMKSLCLKISDFVLKGRALTGSRQGNVAQCARLSSAASSEALESQLVDLKSWLSSLGGWSHADLVLQTSPLGVKVPVSAGALLVKLPPELQLGAGPRPVWLDAIAAQIPEQLWAARLGLLLASERLRGSESLFHPYIRALPQAFPTVPLFSDKPCLDALQFMTLTHQVRILEGNLFEKRAAGCVGFGRGMQGRNKSSYALLAPLPSPRCTHNTCTLCCQVSKRQEWLQSFVSTTLDRAALTEPKAAHLSTHFPWAWAAASSRAFRAQHGQPPVLLPLVDMANHAGDAANASVRGLLDEAPGTIGLVATRDLEAGAEVTISYGALSNDDLLLDYGAKDCECGVKKILFRSCVMHMLRWRAITF